MFRKSSEALNIMNTAVLTRLSHALENVVEVRDEILLLEPGDENYEEYIAIERLLRELIGAEIMKNGTDIEDVFKLGED